MPGHDIQSAALFINNVLTSKGYISESEKIYFGDSEARSDRNDTRIINTIYALINTIENDSKAKEAAQRKTGALERELERETNLRTRVESRYDALEKQIQTSQKKANNLEMMLDDEKNKSHELRETALRLQYSLQQFKLQSANELRRKDMELAWLRERVRDPRRASKSLAEFSSKTPTAISGSLASTRLAHLPTNPEDEQMKLHNELTSTNIALSQELTSFNSELVSENKLLFSLLNKVKVTIQNLTEGRIHEKLAGFDFVGKGNESDSAGVAIRAASSEELGEQVLLSIAQIRDILNSPNFVSLAELKEKETRVESLEFQLKEMTSNWEKALKTMEDWRAYRENRKSGGRNVNTGKNGLDDGQSSIANPRIRSTSEANLKRRTAHQSFGSSAQSTSTKGDNKIISQTETDEITKATVVYPNSNTVTVSPMRRSLIPDSKSTFKQATDPKRDLEYNDQALELSSTFTLVRTTAGSKPKLTSIDLTPKAAKRASNIGQFSRAPAPNLPSKIDSDYTASQKLEPKEVGSDERSTSGADVVASTGN
ncbi:hypothetical protein AWJ20_1620 [Sugiyamaella lignohabitans]|uniref:Afadin and alpha-actinin-binding-domain-containing protein n=1 Tax=Sugiyamaella lignohabitans TaxID=796027 RepID=A0A167DVA3_9ASCO|nr:uncharacterized protein AWJ20_1620 [Sugiyamaella lignohabitans]ANB13334.1 hypothetical protein AWJ20_1620 [Sugiyamaella lignohabitans]